MSVYLLCFWRISNSRKPSEGMHFLQLCVNVDEEWYLKPVHNQTVIHSQACKTCDTPNSATCATSGQDGEGVPDADFVVYVAARSSRCTGNFLAYAAHCFHDKSTDRFGLLICYHSLCMDACVRVCILRCALTLASTQHSHMHACSISIRDMQNIMSPPLIWCVQAYCWSCKPVSKACKWARHWLHCSAYLAWADSCTGAYGCTCMPVWGLRGCNCIWMLTIGVQQHSGWQDKQSLLWILHARCFLQDWCLSIEMQMATLAPHGIILDFPLLLESMIQSCKLTNARRLLLLNIRTKL